MDFNPDIATAFTILSVSMHTYIHDSVCMHKCILGFSKKNVFV